MARIALISQFYPPEPCAAANRVSAMARAFAEANHDVRVFTAMPSFPNSAIASEYARKKHFVENDGRVVVERVWTYLGKPGWPGIRLLHWLTVAIGISIRLSLVRHKFDLIIVSSPPITLALPAIISSITHAAPLWFDVRDVFPEIAIKMGAWESDSFLAHSVGRIADTMYRRSTLVTCVTETARTEIIARGIPPERVFLAPNGFDDVEQASDAPYPAIPGVRDVVFVGNMGLATGLDVIIDAASLLLDDPTIRFILIGSGVDQTRLRARVKSAGVTNVTFAGTLPRADALRALRDASATIVPLVHTIVDSLPTKIFDAMLVGTPIIVSAAGEAKRLVELADAGLAVKPGDPTALISALRRILNEPELAERFRLNGPAFVRKFYDRAAVMKRLVEVVRELRVL